MCEPDCGIPSHGAAAVSHSPRRKPGGKNRKSNQSAGPTHLKNGNCRRAAAQKAWGEVFHGHTPVAIYCRRYRG